MLKLSASLRRPYLGKRSMQSHLEKQMPAGSDIDSMLRHKSPSATIVSDVTNRLPERDTSEIDAPWTKPLNNAATPIEHRNHGLAMEPASALPSSPCSPFNLPRLPERTLSAPAKPPSCVTRSSSTRSYTSTVTSSPSLTSSRRLNYDFLPPVHLTSAPPIPTRSTSASQRHCPQRFYGRHCSTSVLQSGRQHHLPPLLESYHLRRPEDLPPLLKPLMSIPRLQDSIADDDGVGSLVSTQAPSKLSLRQSSISSLRHARLHVNGPDVTGFTKVPADVQVGTIFVSDEDFRAGGSMSRVTGTEVDDLDNSDGFQYLTEDTNELSPSRMRAAAHQMDGAFDTRSISTIAPHDPSRTWSSRLSMSTNTTALVVHRRKPGTENSDCVTRGDSPAPRHLLIGSEDSMSSERGKECDDIGCEKGLEAGAQHGRCGRQGMFTRTPKSEWRKALEERLERLRCWIGFRFGAAW